MPRQYKSPVTKLCMSPSRLRVALDLSFDLVSAAIKTGELPCYVVNGKNRVLFSDAEAWIRTFPRKGVCHG